MGSMHEYYIKGKDFKFQKIIILAVSLCGAYIISWLLGIISTRFGWNLWWVEIPSILGVYKLIEELIDKFCWSKFYGIPSFDGIWKGYFKTSYDDFTREYPVKCIIKQDSKMICIVFEMEKSTSYSIAASMDVSKINGTTLKYDYINVPKVEQNEVLNVHLGSNTFKLNENKLEGEYYNNQRGTSGKIFLERMEEN